jgi:ATP-dependent DNA helicase RecG
VKTIGAQRGKRITAELVDEKSQRLELTWFKGLNWIKNYLKPNTEYVAYGKPVLFNGKFNIVHPELEVLTPETGIEKGFQAMYHTSEKMKTSFLDSKNLGKYIKQLIPHIEENIEENLPLEIIRKAKLISRTQALAMIHAPLNPEEIKQAQLRLKFEELFIIQTKLLQQNRLHKKHYEGFIFSKVGEHFNHFYKEKLPFELTNAQKRVIKEIRTDMGSGIQMNRLLQGDVGSGKTMVSLLCMLIAKDNAFQSCLMAPTEILANQHYENISEALKGCGVQVALLTGSSNKAQRSFIHTNLMNGSIDILIGTHALLEEKVQFANLGLVVIDEQHRFGVEQRSRLWHKNTKFPHVLVMTATPIPRTLAMTLYGDLDVSVIDELPPGRKPIQTIHRYESARLAVFGFIREQIKLGRQVYIVYPLIKESEHMDYKDLMEGYENISREFPLPEYRISIVHGQMKNQDKDAEMQRFVKGETQIMVATTVIEVGVNVPNASIMLIESAERFGLSQLHQLRGRVGRGADQSYCILMTSYKLGEESKTRLETMVRTNDGFEIADVDMQLRGPGNIQGTEQSGALNLRLADLSKDQQLLSFARHLATELINEDPQLEKTENLNLKNYLALSEKASQNWSRIS